MNTHTPNTTENTTEPPTGIATPFHDHSVKKTTDKNINEMDKQMKMNLCRGVVRLCVQTLQLFKKENKNCIIKSDNFLHTQRDAIFNSANSIFFVEDG